MIGCITHERNEVSSPEERLGHQINTKKCDRLSVIFWVVFPVLEAGESTEVCMWLVVAWLLATAEDTNAHRQSMCMPKTISMIGIQRWGSLIIDGLR